MTRYPSPRQRDELPTCGGVCRTRSAGNVGSQLFRCVVPLAVALGLFFVALPGHAVSDGDGGEDELGSDEQPRESEFDGYSDRWTGAFVGLGVFGGPTWSANSAAGGETGWTIGVRARMNQVLSLFDVQLDYRYTSLDTTWQSNTLEVDHHAVGAALAVHPLFLMNLGGDRISYMLAASYLQFGVTYDVTGVRYPSAGVDGSDPDYGINVGAGTDFPVTDPDAGGALWIGGLYRFNVTTVDLAPFDGENLAEHMAMMSASYRHNGLLF